MNLRCARPARLRGGPSATTLRIPQAWFPSLFFPLALLAIFTASFSDAPGHVPGFPPVRGFLDFAVAGIGPAGRAHRRAPAQARRSPRTWRPGSSTGSSPRPSRGGPSSSAGSARASPRASCRALLFLGIAVAFGARVEGGLGGVLVLIAVRGAPRRGDRRAGRHPRASDRVGRGRAGHVPAVLRPAVLLVGVLPARDDDRLVQGHRRRQPDLAHRRRHARAGHRRRHPHARRSSASHSRWGSRCCRSASPR